MALAFQWMKILMTLFFLDVNVWMALSDSAHRHHIDCWSWLNGLSANSKLIFSRFTQIGLLRLLTNPSVMGPQTHSLRKAWSVYDQWLDDPRVEFYPEPQGIDAGFRDATEPFAAQRAPKALGDCWLLAYAKGLNATLVTLDWSLREAAAKQGCSAIIPG